jgi:hypothetical protein
LCSRYERQGNLATLWGLGQFGYNFRRGKKKTSKKSVDGVVLVAASGAFPMEEYQDDKANQTVQYRKA